MEIPNDIIKIIFKKDLAKLVCLNRKYNSAFKHLLKPYEDLKEGKVYSLYGYYKVGKDAKGDSYMIRKPCIESNSRMIKNYCIEGDDIMRFCYRLGLTFKTYFYNGRVGTLFDLARDEKDITHKDVYLKFMHSHNVMHNQVTKILAKDNLVFISYVYCVYVYQSIRKLTPEQIMWIERY